MNIIRSLQKYYLLNYYDLGYVILKYFMLTWM